MKRNLVFVAVSILVLGVLNYGIFEKEEILSEGENVFLELAPVDPRSLIQGDFMALRFAVEGMVPNYIAQGHPARGLLVIRPDENNVAQFVRFHDGSELAKDEKLIRYNKPFSRGIFGSLRPTGQDRIEIVPDSYFFQEGHEPFYRNARYGVFRFKGPDSYILVALADEAQNIIVPEETAE